MKLSSTDQDSIVALLTRIYLDIFAIEEEFQLLVGVDDFRPRIDYFHDAIRAFTSGEDAQRLAVEMLAYDLECMRYIQSMPLAPFRAGGEMMSAGAEVVEVKPGLTVKRARPDRATRERLSELYQHYAVLFAALLKPMADRDYKDRVDNLNQDVAELNTLIDNLKALNKGKSTIGQITSAVQHLEEDGLRHEMLNFIQQQQHTKKDDVKKLAGFLKAHAGNKDKQIAAIEQAHMKYALAQLAVFEESKTLLKKMAGQGMNLVGKFVEASVAKTQREMGR